jgi:hypothetical protein
MDLKQALITLTLAAVVACDTPNDTRIRHWTLADAEAARATDTPMVVETEFFADFHCSTWAGASILQVFDERYGDVRFIGQFIRDPEGGIGPTGVASFSALASRPPDAIWTGWREGRRELWLEADRSAAIIGYGSQWERWPAPPYPILCL